VIEERLSDSDSSGIANVSFPPKPAVRYRLIADNRNHDGDRTKAAADALIGLTRRNDLERGKAAQEKGT
jgi:hypothetical protein